MKKKKRISKQKRIIIVAIIAIIIWIMTVYLYTTYNNIEINQPNYEATRTLSTKPEQTVEKTEEESKKVADMIEETTRKVVGISKLKNAGNSILSKSTESELGLGTGIIVTEDGYILSNEHVTGEKYSKCYVTLENGNTYDGTVMWSDSRARSVHYQNKCQKFRVRSLSRLKSNPSRRNRICYSEIRLDSSLEEP